MRKIGILIVLVLVGCSTVSLQEDWKNPDIVIFDASKVLVVGLAQNIAARKEFENSLAQEFIKRDVEAVRSLDLFDIEFTNTKRSEEELTALEQQLIDKDFDAILFTKLLGYESRETLRKRMADWDGYNIGFKDDYIGNQSVYYNEGYTDTFKVYHVQTSLYCICSGKERELIWRGSIDITDPVDIQKSIKEYVKLLTVALEEQDLIFHSEK